MSQQHRCDIWIIVAVYLNLIVNRSALFVFLLCVICQIAVGTFVNSQQSESYAKFLEASSQRAELDDGDFPGVSSCLHQYTTAELVVRQSSTVTVMKIL